MEAVVEPPLVVILGPTASGKTAVALELAEAVGGEIICADSRTVYRGLDIGTAKPTSEERARVPHHILDKVNPDEVYSAARFQRDAQAAIRDIRQRHKVPFLVGGSGLYIDSVLFDYQFAERADPRRRAELEGQTLDELIHYSKTHNIKIPNNYHNKRYVIRAIEQKGINTKRLTTPIDNTIIVGITTERSDLQARMIRRSQLMFETGIINETARIADMYGWDCLPLQAPVYRLSREVIAGDVTIDDAITKLAASDWQLARKQLTWFRRNEYIHWLLLDEVVPYMRTCLTQSIRATIKG